MVDQDVMKGPSPIENNDHTPNSATRKPSPPSDKESKFARVKRMLTCTQQFSRMPNTYDEAKVGCKARKRKERQESVGSTPQDRKFIRSNSEERPIGVVDSKDIRRVSSHEDFQKSNQNCNHHQQPLHERNETLIVEEKNGVKKTSPCRDVSADIFIYDECEYEKRRSHERFSKPFQQRTKYGAQGRRQKMKHFPKTGKDKMDNLKENSVRRISPRRFQDAAERKKVLSEDVLPEKPTESSYNFLNQEDSQDRSPSPTHSPPLDITTLHEQIDCCDPIPSSSSRMVPETTDTTPSLSVVSNRLLSSPRNSIIVTQRIYLNPEIPQNNTSMGNNEMHPVEERLKQISKQINGIKKKMKKFDEDFEMRHGYRTSHADKLSDKTMKKLCVELSRLKREQKQLKDDSSSAIFYSNNENQKEGWKSKKEEVTLEVTLKEIEQVSSVSEIVVDIVHSSIRRKFIGSQFIFVQSKV